MSPEEKQLRMLMLDWPQDKINKYNELRDSLFQGWVSAIDALETQDEQQVYICAFGIANLKFGKYVVEKY